MTPLALLKDAIKRSGLSTSAFATDVLIRDPRTIRRWLAGEFAIPPIVVEFLKRKHAERVS